MQQEIDTSVERGEDLTTWHIYLGVVVGVIFLEVAISCAAIIGAVCCKGQGSSSATFDGEEFKSYLELYKKY